MSKKKTSIAYKVIKGLLYIFYPKIETVGAEKLPQEACIIVGNHVQMHGPLACELHFPIERYTWCAGPMMKLKEVPDYAYVDFWSYKPKWSKWFYRLLSYLIAPFSVCLFNNANTIAVHRDTRIVSTFKETIRTLQDGTSVVIFPEHNKPHNHIIYEFESNFIDIAKLYYKKTGKELLFVPLYIAPTLKKMYVGDPIRFQSDMPIQEECKRISTYLMEQITTIACDLPEHIVIPYLNLPRKDRRFNTSSEVNTNEKASR